MKNIISIGLLCLFIALIYGYSFLTPKLTDKAKDIKENGTIEQLDTLLLDQNQLIKLDSGKQSLKDFLSAPIKIIGYIDLGCSMCSSYLPNWAEFVEQKATKWDIPTLLVVKGNSKGAAKYVAIEQLAYRFCVYYDSGNHFYQKNHLTDDPLEQAFLIGPDNTILMCANPALSEQHEKQFWKAIQRFRRKN
ncbi:MAG: hypothetical protein AB8H47_00520 [Bacteroidia bacterium]